MDEATFSFQPWWNPGEDSLEHQPICQLQQSHASSSDLPWRELQEKDDYLQEILHSQRRSNLSKGSFKWRHGKWFSGHLHQDLGDRHRQVQEDSKRTHPCCDCPRGDGEWVSGLISSRSNCDHLERPVWPHFQHSWRIWAANHLAGPSTRGRPCHELQRAILPCLGRNCRQEREP